MRPTMPGSDCAICWFRRDLRLYDHAALYHALKSSRAVHCVFVFDTDLLAALPDPADRRVEFIWRCIQELHAELGKWGGTLHILHGSARQLIPQFARQTGARAVFCNRDYEPGAIARDTDVSQQLAQHGIHFHSFKDQVIFESDEVLNGSGKPYAVFTPYKNAWLGKLDEFHLRPYPTERYAAALVRCPASPLPSLDQLGFRPTNLVQLGIPCGMSGASRLLDDFLQRIDHYHEWRDFPAIKGVSYLSPHLRFGTISIRHLAALALHNGSPGARTWLNELIWREFYQMLLFHHPRLAEGATFKPQYQNLPFPNDAQHFAAWCEARTGFPIIDAAMRQLNSSGYMHNRLRMIVASFLVKDLLVDWRWGEAYFARHLLDFDFAANNGGWQWAASTGCDAQPWFRIFNPVTQSEKFDPQGKFIRRYLPELASCPDRWLHAPWTLPQEEQRRCGIEIGKDYPAPIVNHAAAREQALALFRKCG